MLVNLTQARKRVNMMAFHYVDISGRDGKREDILAGRMISDCLHLL